MAGSGVPKGYWGKQMRSKPQAAPPKVNARGPAREGKCHGKTKT